MIYHYTDKETGRPEVYASVPAICSHTGLNKDTLYYHFTRKKKVVYEDEKHLIYQLPGIKRKK